MKRLIVDGLERACWAMRHFQRVPVLGHLYNRCWLAEWSYAPDRRWATRQWPYHDEESWEAWWDGVDKESADGRWHAF
jgi:hypothetical protein